MPIHLIITGGTLAIVLGALDGYGHATLATAWQTASEAEREAIEAAALALNAIDSGMTAIGILALFGIALASIGAAIVFSRIVANWLGWAAIGIGVLGTVTGLAFAHLGPTAVVLNGLFRPLMIATIYFIGLAVALRRAPTTDSPQDRTSRHELADPESSRNSTDALPS